MEAIDHSKRNFKVTLISLFVVSSLAGCAQLKNNGEIIGAIGGAVVGQYLGKKVGGSNGKAIGMLLGALAGAAIGKHLSEEEKKDLRRQSAVALANARDGEKVVWKSKESNAHAIITPRNTRSEKKSVKMLKDKNLVVVPNMKLIGEEYASTAENVRVRNQATTDSRIIMHLYKGQKITAVGEVVGQPWVMIAINGVSVGYVHKSLLGKPQIKTDKTLREPMNLDTVDLEEVNRMAANTIDLDNIEVVPEETLVITDCRTIDLDIVSDQGTENTQLDTCKGVDGNWENEVA